MPRRHAALALVVAVCWAVNFVVIDIGLESFPPLLFAALRFGLIAVPAIFFVPRPDVRWPVVVAVGLFICVGQFGLLFVAMNTGLPAGPRVGDRASSTCVHDPVRRRCARRAPKPAPGRWSPPRHRRSRGDRCRSLPRRPSSGSRTRCRVGGIVGLRERRDSSGQAEAAPLATRVVKRCRTGAAARALPNL